MDRSHILHQDHHRFHLIEKQNHWPYNEKLYFLMTRCPPYNKYTLTIVFKLTIKSEYLKKNIIDYIKCFKFNHEQNDKKKVCVFCGSSMPLNSKLIKQETINIADILFEKNIDLIYGGAKIGIMGIISNRMMEKGGKVTGIIPKVLVKKEVINNNITKLIVVNSMHERKKMMYDLADAFIILPGGIGTLEELSEIITWKVLGIKNKIIIIFNLNGFYNSLIEQFKIMQDNNFLYSNIFEEVSIINSVSDLGDLLD